MNSFQRAFFAGAKAGKRTALQDAVRKDKMAAASAKRAQANLKKREQSLNLKRRLLIEKEKQSKRK